MSITIISYSLTGNNEVLAISLAAEFEAEHIKITEPIQRKTSTIILDVLFNRTPIVSPMAETVADSDLVIFVAPIWMGHVASPLRSYFQYYKNRINDYAFISISGGADGGNKGLGDELLNRIGKKPLALIDLHIADLVPREMKRQLEYSSAYRLSEGDVVNLTKNITKSLWNVIESKSTVAV